MEAHMDRHGRVTITFESQAEALDAPQDGRGIPLKYLPCGRGCGRLERVAYPACSVICDECYGARQTCAWCGEPRVGEDGEWLFRALESESSSFCSLDCAFANAHAGDDRY